MNRNTIEFTGITARMTGFNIELCATAPDDQEETVTVYNSDIKEIYGMNSAKFFEQFGEDSKMLFELFTSINGISVSE